SLSFATGSKIYCLIYFRKSQCDTVEAFIFKDCFMGLPKQKFREIVFQLIFSHDLSRADDEDSAFFMMRQLAVTKKIMREAIERQHRVCDKIGELDLLIAKHSLAYKFERIPRVERNILRLGVFEILYDEEIPPPVAIAEAIRLSRKFATPEGATFVNAVLDAIYQFFKKEKESIACAQN
ncbi:MAG: transcription antitermination factor NusB, partial [Anaerolineae bacterium]